MPVGEVMARELRILGSHGMPIGGYRPLLAMVTAGKLDPGRLVTATVPIEEAGDVLAAMDRLETLGFTVIDRY